ncbi:hypothetical protein RHMOL_Rhmol06G0207400 [Rhododendron molle]|uniref:Uncharacterized protein n=1 Tax=Rhododendron molle TaxID=49168 RepID=A0ACC0NGT6_RHOML|nr:hypothetical protein RHMOL_Rhmol06G0207400 [Rhododendron molle]
MGLAAGELYFDFGISLSTTATASNNDPTTATASSAAGLGQSPFLFPSLPLPFSCFPSPRSSYPLLSSSLLFSPSKVAGQLGNQPFPVSPRMPVTSPRWKDRLSMLWNPDSKGFGQVQVGGKTFFGPCVVGVLGICDTITTTTTYSSELHRSDKESLKVFTIWELIRSSCQSMNWRHLVLKTKLTKWHLPGIASLLKNSPDLEMLDIHIQPGPIPFCTHDDRWLMEYEIDGENFWNLQRSSFLCLRRHLKTIRIRRFKIESCAVKFVHFLLRKACVLEKLVIETNRDSYPDEEKLFTSETWNEFSEDIRSSPRASPQAGILIL